MEGLTFEVAHRDRRTNGTRSKTRWSYVGAASCKLMMGQHEAVLGWADKGLEVFYRFIDGEVTRFVRN